jgi:hypothetical protein
METSVLTNIVMAPGPKKTFIYIIAEKNEDHKMHEWVNTYM